MPTLCGLRGVPCRPHRDRKSTRLNSSHTVISYAVFCLKKKKTSLNSSHTVNSYAAFCLKKCKRLRDDADRDTVLCGCIGDVLACARLVGGVHVCSHDRT